MERLAEASCLGGTLAAQRDDRGVDVGRSSFSALFEIGDNPLHEARIEALCLRGVAEMLEQDREGQLRRLGALIAPFEP
jgi:hypothetical protein